MKAMLRLSVVILLMSGSGSLSAVAQQTVSVANLPPVVVETVPRAGDTNVDPLLTEIQVTFSKDMLTDKMWSWVIHTPESFPPIAGEVRYTNDRTNVLPVRLQPGRTYAIWINSPNGKHIAFRDTSNMPAIPYLLVFKTRDNQGDSDLRESLLR
jgi:hypothetical protein